MIASCKTKYKFFIRQLKKPLTTFDIFLILIKLLIKTFRFMIT
jgi:hypothetical protein